MYIRCPYVGFINEQFSGMKFNAVSCVCVCVCVYMLLEDHRFCSVVYRRDCKMLIVSLYFFRG